MQQIFHYSALLWMLWSATLSAQELPKVLNDYTLDDVETYCWTVNDYDPQTVYPAEWTEGSAIYNRMAYWRDTRSKRDLKYDIVEMALVAELYQERIHILDKAALERFSEVVYGYEGKGYLYESTINIRIIKPDGRVVIIDNVQELSIPVEGSKKRKIAIPQLAVGDILDYYYFSRKIYHLFMIALDPLEFEYLLDFEDPIQTFVFNWVTDEDWETVYMPGSHAIPLKQTKIERIDSTRAIGKRTHYLYTIQHDSIPALETEWFNYPQCYRPFGRFSSFALFGFMTWANRDSTIWYSREYSRDQITVPFFRLLHVKGKMRDPYQGFKLYLKRHYGKRPELSDDVWLREWDYFLRYWLINEQYYAERHAEGAELSYDVSIEYYLPYFIFGLHKRGLPYDLLFLKPREDGPLWYREWAEGILKEIEVYNFSLCLRVRTQAGKPYYLFEPSPYNKLGKMHYDTEGTTALAMGNRGRRRIRVHRATLDTVVLGVPSFEENRSVATHRLRLNTEEPTQVHATSEFLMTGEEEEYYRSSIFNWVDQARYEANRYTSESLWSYLLKDIKDTTAFLKEENEAYQKQLSELGIDYLGIEEEDYFTLLNHKIISTANRVGEDSLHFELDYKLQGYVKPIGDDYLLELGHLFNLPALLSKKEENRTVDAWFDYPYEQIDRIAFDIPEGYEVKGIEELNTTLKNGVGVFESRAWVEGQTLWWTLHRTEEIIYLPVKNWSWVVDLVNAGASLSSKAILLKKK